MYFHDRAEAGQKLAEQLQKYRYENCVVVALSLGGVLVAEQIATSLHSVLTLLLSETIDIPGEQAQFGTLNQDGGFVQNAAFSSGEFDEYYNEFHGYLEDQKRERFQHMNQLVGDGGVLDHDLLRDHTIILVSDGLVNGAQLDAAAAFLKPIRLKRLVTATPIASVQAVDSMHILSDELHVLNVADNFMGVDHYYDENTVPTYEEATILINRTILNWR